MPNKCTTAPEALWELDYRGVDAPQSASPKAAPAPLRARVSRYAFIRDGMLAPELIKRIRTCAMAITGEQHSIDDIQQEVLLRLLKMERHEWETIECQEAYVIAMARNVSRTWLRKRRENVFKYRKFMNTELHKLEGPPTDVAGAACAADDLLRILQPLGPECAEVFVRVRLYGHSSESVARTMQMSLSAIRARLDKADLHFMRLLEKEQQGPSIGSRLVKFLKLEKRA